MYVSLFKLPEQARSDQESEDINRRRFSATGYNAGASASGNLRRSMGELANLAKFIPPSLLPSVVCYSLLFAITFFYVRDRRVHSIRSVC